MKIIVPVLTIVGGFVVVMFVWNNWGPGANA